MKDMSKFRLCTVMVIVSICGACARGAEPAAKPAQPAAAAATEPSLTSPELAVRYASLAQDTLHQTVVLAPHFKEAAALLMAAMKLDPAEPRYPRMLYEAMLQIGDNAGALNALKAYRAINVSGRPDQDQPRNDQLAMVNYIDLSAGQLETAEQRFDYYKSILDSRAPDPVKSHAALRAAQVAGERGQAEMQDSFMGQALRLNPLNLNALRSRLDQMDANGTPVERVGVLLSMLKSNPMQPAVTYRLAREVGDAGLPEDSLIYYAQSVDLAGRLGTPMGREFALAYASELYLTGKPQLLVGTRTISEQLIKQDAGDVESLLIRWLAERAPAGGGGDKVVLGKIQQQLINASLNRVLVLRQQLGIAGATTRPVESPEAVAIPDLSEDLAKLKDDKFATLRLPYAQAVCDFAWYLVYVANQPAEAAKLLPSLKTLLSDKDPLVVRIEGWIFMAQGQLDQAGVKLKAVADQDVMAQAATYLLWAKNPAEKDPAMSSARKLLMEHPSGLLAVLLMDTLKDLNVKLVARDDAPAIQARIADFPKAWLRIIDAPQNFYDIRADMVGGKIGFEFGEPIFARVQIKNKSPYEITIGAEGVIHNDLWFDAQLRGLFQKQITGAAYERLSQVLVLKPGQTVTQTVRLDQGQLAEVLTLNVGPAITFTGQVRTNPRGDGTSGPGGYGPVMFASITERSGFALNQNTLNGFTNTMASGSPTQKIRAMEVMSAEVVQLRKMPEQTDQSKALTNFFVDTVQKSANDPAPPVATWGTFLTAVQDPGKRPAIIQTLITEPDPTRQILGLLLVNSLPADEQKRIATAALASKEDEMIKLYATGMLDMVEIAASRPTTAPSATIIPGGAGEAATGGPAPLINPVGGGEAPKQP
jgi:tetratricopeptide (TPR) repeat protein